MIRSTRAPSLSSRLSERAWRHRGGTGGIAVAASADARTPFERDAVVPRQAATLGDQYFHVEWTAEPVQPGMPGSRGTSTTTMAKPRRTSSCRSRLWTPRAARDKRDPANRRHRPGERPQLLRPPGPGKPSYQLSVVSFEFLEPQNGH